MVENIFYIILALLGISFLIFIHELGHYLMARRLGVTVEVFSIGFGKAIYSWKRKGVLWKIGILPFGGYVKMAGTEKEGIVEPYLIEGGLLAQKPWNQIKIVAMGPLVNLAFALLAFTLLWISGGREKSFSEFTQHIGWVDPDSEMYQKGIRSGDEITQVKGGPFKSFEHFAYEVMYDKSSLTINGLEIDYQTKQKVPFTYEFPAGKNRDAKERLLAIASSFGPAQYAIYEKKPDGKGNDLLPSSPLQTSTITYGDRIVWIDGELIFSKKQLVEIVNMPKVLLTVLRQGEVFLTKVPRLKIKDLRLTAKEKEEIDDWRFEAKIKENLNEVVFIPYNLDANLTVEASLQYVDEKSRSQPVFTAPLKSQIEIPLQKGDRILAVQGEKIASSYELMEKLQTKKSLLIVQKMDLSKGMSWKRADHEFEDSFDIAHLQKIALAVGTDQAITRSGSLRLLQPITPVPLHTFPLPPSQSVAREEKLEKYRKTIQEIPDVKQREETLKVFESYQNRLMLGIVLQDLSVMYNPSPLVLFSDAVTQVYRTLFALIKGAVSPKYLGGPIEIIQVIQRGWSLGVKEAIYWLGMVSLNLGLLNLLPIPVLDGGHIVLALWEKITRKPIKQKTREKLILPFIFLLIALFIYLTYNDLSRLWTRFF